MGPLLVLDAKFTSLPQQHPQEAHGASHSSHGDFFVHLSPCSYRIWWIIIALVHVVCMVKFTVEFLTYWLLPHLHIAITLEMYNVIMPLSDLRILSVIHGTIAAAHGFLVLQMVFNSVLFQHFAFTYRPQIKPLKWITRSIKTTPIGLKTIPTKPNFWLTANCRLISSIFGKRGLLG